MAFRYFEFGTLRSSRKITVALCENFHAGDRKEIAAKRAKESGQHELLFLSLK